MKSARLFIVPVVATLLLGDIVFSEEVSGPSELGSLIEQLYQGELNRSLTADELQAMSEDELYQTAEFYRLGHKPFEERNAWASFVERFPSSDYASKGKLRVALSDVLTMPNPEEPLNALRELSVASGDAAITQSAGSYARALSAPVDLLDLQILMDLAQISESDYGNPPSADLLAAKVADLLQREGFDLLLDQQTGSADDKAIFWAKCGWTLFRANKLEESLRYFERTYTEFPEVKEVAAYAMAFEGQVRRAYLQQKEQGDLLLKRASDEFPLSKWSAWALLRRATFAQMDHDYVESAALLRRIVRRHRGTEEAQMAQMYLDNIQGRLVGERLQASQPAVEDLASASVPNLIENACGVVAVESVLAQFNLTPEKEEILSCVKPDATGRTNVFNIVKTLDNYDVRSSVFELGLKDLQQEASAGTPLILHLKDHFAVLKSISETEVVTVDDMGEHVMDMSLFLYQWDGYVISVEGPSEKPSSNAA